jgi:RNA polymerase sigma factor (sigma-70 family)
MKRCESLAYELDLTKLRDEELVVLAAECHYHPAEEALLLRFLPWSQRRIAQLGRRWNLTSSDVEDAAQDAVFAIVKAMTRYNTLEAGNPAGCPFRVFLDRVLKDRFKDFLKQLRRQAGNAHHARAAKALAANREPDPARAAQVTELSKRVHDLLAKRDDFTRQVVDGVMVGLRLRTIAANLGRSYDVVKRRWRQERTRLAKQLDERTRSRV